MIDLIITVRPVGLQPQTPSEFHPDLRKARFAELRGRPHWIPDWDIGLGEPGSSRKYSRVASESLEVVTKLPHPKWCRKEDSAIVEGQFTEIVGSHIQH
jgi:hypothetical protein